MTYIQIIEVKCIDGKRFQIDLYKGKHGGQVRYQALVQGLFPHDPSLFLILDSETTPDASVSKAFDAIRSTNDTSAVILSARTSGSQDHISDAAIETLL